MFALIPHHSSLFIKSLLQWELLQNHLEYFSQSKGFRPLPYKFHQTNPSMFFKYKVRDMDLSSNSITDDILNLPNASCCY